jgi:hypothetical protein
MKFKWYFPMLPWFAIGWAAVLQTRFDWPTPLEFRVLHVVGSVVMSTALLAAIQPWRAEGAPDG